MTYEPPEDAGASVASCINTSTLPSSLMIAATESSPPPPSRPASAVDAPPTTTTVNTRPSAGCLSNRLAASSAAPCVLYVMRITGEVSRAEVRSLEETMGPQHLNMATTSSAVVPGTRPLTSTTLPRVRPEAPLIESGAPLP